MKAFLFIGGEYPERENFLAEYRTGISWLAPNSGLDRAAAWGIAPDLAVGDMDSVSGEKALQALSPDKILRLEADKDETDTEAALKTLWLRGYGEITIVGGGGGRLDHVLAIALLFDRKPRPQVWLATGGRAQVLEGSLAFSCLPGETLSVFPLGADTLRMRSEGLYWPLEGLEFEKGYFGISNRATSSEVRLEVLSGVALMIRPYSVSPRENRERGRRLP